MMFRVATQHTRFQLIEWQLRRITQTFQSHKHFASSSHHSRTGQFGIVGLHEPSDFERLTQNAIQRACDHKQQVVNGPVCTNTFDHLDAISDAVTLLLDVTELCKVVHPDQFWRDGANQAQQELNEFVIGLNMDISLHTPLAKLLDGADSGKYELTPEQYRVATSLKLEFERDGVHLTKDDATRVAELHNNQFKCSFEVSRTANIPPDTLANGPVAKISSHRIKASAPEHIANALISRSSTGMLEAFRNVFSSDSNSSDTTNAKSESTINLPLDPTVVHTVLQEVGDPWCRKQVMIEYDSFLSEDRLNAVAALAKVRQELASNLGYTSYSDMIIETCAMNSPKEVVEFLHKVSAVNLPLAEEECRQLALTKAKHLEKRAADGIQEVEANTCSLTGDVVLYPWDEVYYKIMLRRQSNPLLEAQQGRASKFFTLDNVLNGIGHIVDELFDIQVVEATNEAREKGELWDSTIRKLLLKSGNQLVGELFLDLYPRGDKPQGVTAHFQIKSGYQPSNSSEYSTASGALVCSLFRDQGLAHSDVILLFHEFGHALHSLLSRTQYQFASGTRGERDFVEVPSTLFEMFASEPLVLQSIARCPVSGKPGIDDSLLDSYVSSREKGTALELQHQIILGLFDQYLHSASEPKTPESIAEGLKTIYENHWPLEFHPEIHLNGLRFTHMIGYGASYYTYLYSRAIATDIWKTLFESDPLNRNSGNMIHSAILAHGGSKHPDDMIRQVLNRPIQLDAMVEQISKSHTF